MEETEYNQNLKQIEADYEAAKKALYIKFAMSKVKFKLGDIIKDSAKTILIDKITTYKGLELPEPVYSGFELTKDLKPKKNSNRGSMYGTHPIELVRAATILFSPPSDL